MTEHLCQSSCQSNTKRGTADGTFNSYTAFRGFRLHEVTTDHLHAPFGGATGFAFMTRSKIESLSPKAHAVLEANTGCELAARAGATVDGWQQEGMDLAKNEGGHTFTEFDDAAFEELKSRVAESIVAGFDGRVPGGAELIDTWNAAVAQAAIDAPEMVE